MLETQTEPFASWAIVEVMGHRKLAGFCEEVQIAGGALLRIRVPALAEREGDWNSTIPATPQFDQFYNSSAIFSRRAGSNFDRPRPLARSMAADGLSRSTTKASSPRSAAAL